MQKSNEESYAVQFGMLMFEDRKMQDKMKEYLEPFRNILEVYSRFLRKHPGLVLPDPGEGYEEEVFRQRAKLLGELCRNSDLEYAVFLETRIGGFLFQMLMEAVYRTLILVKYYAPEGVILSEILRETYCTSEIRAECQLYMKFLMSRATFYRYKKKAVKYAGYFFFEAVLPEMEGRIGGSII